MGITMNQRTFEILLHQGDDIDRLSELHAAAMAAKPKGQATGTENGIYAAAAQEHDEFEAEAKTRAVPVKMKPPPRKEYEALRLQHPPREDEDGDAVIGANAATFAEALLRLCIVAPVLDEAEMEAFLDSLNQAQFILLADEALAINRVVFAPKAPLLGSAPSPKSDETSVISPDPSD